MRPARFLALSLILVIEPDPLAVSLAERVDDLLTKAHSQLKENEPSKAERTLHMVDSILTLQPELPHGLFVKARKIKVNLHAQRRDWHGAYKAGMETVALAAECEGCDIDVFDVYPHILAALRHLGHRPATHSNTEDCRDASLHCYLALWRDIREHRTCDYSEYVSNVLWTIFENYEESWAQEAERRAGVPPGTSGAGFAAPIPSEWRTWVADIPRKAAQCRGEPRPLNLEFHINHAALELTAALYTEESPPEDLVAPVAALARKSKDGAWAHSWLHWLEGLQALVQQNPASAVEHFQKSLDSQQDPTDLYWPSWRAHHYLGVAYERFGDTAGAQASFARAAALRVQIYTQVPVVGSRNLPSAPSWSARKSTQQALRARDYRSIMCEARRRDALSAASLQLSTPCAEDPRCHAAYTTWSETSQETPSQDQARAHRRRVDELETELNDALIALGRTLTEKDIPCDRLAKPRAREVQLLIYPLPDGGAAVIFAKGPQATPNALELTPADVEAWHDVLSPSMTSGQTSQRILPVPAPLAAALTDAHRVCIFAPGPFSTLNLHMLQLGDKALGAQVRVTYCHDIIGAPTAEPLPLTRAALVGPSREPDDGAGAEHAALRTAFPSNFAPYSDFPPNLDPSTLLVWSTRLDHDGRYIAPDGIVIRSHHLLGKPFPPQVVVNGCQTSVSSPDDVSGALSTVYATLLAGATMVAGTTTKPPVEQFAEYLRCLFPDPVSEGADNLVELHFRCVRETPAFQQFRVDEALPISIPE